jgi:hypothetical protein
MRGHWHKHGSNWLVEVDDATLLAPGTAVDVYKHDGTVQSKKVQHSKHCGCTGHGHLYFVQRPRVQRSRALSFCSR